MRRPASTGSCLQVPNECYVLPATSPYGYSSPLEGVSKCKNRYHAVMLNGCEASPINKNKRKILRVATNDELQ